MNIFLASSVLLTIGVAFCDGATTNSATVQTVTFSMRKLAFASNQFGIDLYRALNISQDNVVICPFCIGSSLAMVLLGAEGSTAMALRQALYLWGMHPQDIHLAFHDLISHLGVNLRGPEESQPEYLKQSHGIIVKARDIPESNTLRIINNMYIQRHFSIRYPYQFYLHRYYNTSIYPMDFGANSEESTKHINAFFERLTEGKTSHILGHVPSPSTNLLLLNALYFKGALDINMSRVDYSTNSLTEASPVMLEAKRARIRYGVHDYLNCSAVEVPFKGGLISLVALLPNDPDGMPLLETRLSAQRLTDIINYMQVKRINFQMPRISIKQTHGNLTTALYNLGLVDLFTPGYANLFGISDFGWLHVSNMTHASLVEIREAKNSGTVQHQRNSDNVTMFALDKPFLWFIMDNIAGLAIAMGKVVRPEGDLRHR